MKNYKYAKKGNKIFKTLTPIVADKTKSEWVIELQKEKEKMERRRDIYISKISAVQEEIDLIKGM